ncbi:hypothetical protein ACFQT0_26840 [Hymenobacter humi]|uniref:Uncharacterized protein n=1 Tax=Hymenobacter humi TaxID=1411620 RepID=A0ABW2UE26_9BACT
MKSTQSPRLAALLASLFENPSPNYALVAMLVLVAGATVVFGGNRVPGLVTHLVMLLSLLATSRLFNAGWLRSFWYLTMGLIALALVLDVAVLMVAL